MNFWTGFEKIAKKLKAKDRNKLSPSVFVFPKERRYPIEDRRHAANAKARASGTKDQAAVFAAVHAKYPDMGEKSAFAVLYKVADATKEEIRGELKKHEERETPKQEAEESENEQRIEREAGVEKF